MSRGPTELQRLILAELVRQADQAPPDGWEIAENIAPGRGIRSWQRKPTTEREQVSSCLARMATKGWVKRLGKSISNSWCWAITDDGRSTLAGGASPEGARDG